MTLEYRIGDVRDRLAEIPDNSIDLVVTSPPFLALRSYLPADHPDKHREIGSEPTPADFLDTMLGLSAEFARVLAPHGSICIELGDTYAGSGGGGGDLLPGGAKEAHEWGDDRKAANAAHWRTKNQRRDAWPLAKSLTGIPTLYTWSLAYGRNLLREPMTAIELLEWIDALRAHGWSAEHALAVAGSWFAEHGTPQRFSPWRIRNLIVWARPNPPVGALGDKFRPATSYITVACKGPRRYFDLDAVRHPHVFERPNGPPVSRKAADGTTATTTRHKQDVPYSHDGNPAGAPPLDWHADDHPEDGDWLWKLSTQPYKGSHYATYPLALPKRLIEAMCPLRVCTVCGKPSERIVETERHGSRVHAIAPGDRSDRHDWNAERPTSVSTVTVGWSNCGHDAWRTGIVLDPFGGSGTTAEAAQAVGRHAILIDLDARNAELARERVGMFLEISA